MRSAQLRCRNPPLGSASSGESTPRADRPDPWGRRDSEDEITEREVTVLLADFATVWNELFPAEQARLVPLLVERVDVQEDALETERRAPVEALPWRSASEDAFL